MTQRKEFSVLKWIVFPAISIVLAGVIAWFNVRVFGSADGAPYIAIVVLIAGFSIIINKYTDSQNNKLVVAAFVCEIFLTAALIGNAAYSLSVQRAMSIGRQADQGQAASLEQISKLKGSRTQREAVKKLGEHKSAEATFAEYEQILFWIMIAELSLFGVCAFTLFGIAKILGRTGDEDRIGIDQEIGERLSTIVERAPHRARPIPRPASWPARQVVNGLDRSERDESDTRPN